MRALRTMMAIAAGASCSGIGNAAARAEPLFRDDASATVELARDAQGRLLPAGGTWVAASTTTLYGYDQGRVVRTDLASGASATTDYNQWPPTGDVGFGDTRLQLLGLGADGHTLEVLELHAVGALVDVHHVRFRDLAEPELVAQIPAAALDERLPWADLTRAGCSGDGALNTCGVGLRVTGRTLAVSPERLCFGAVEGIVCVEGGAVPAVRLRMPIEALDALPVAQLPETGAWDASYGFAPSEIRWELHDVTGAPDGRVWFIADRVYLRTTPVMTARFVVELGADGRTVRLLDGPHVDSPMVSGPLVYDHRLDALVAWSELGSPTNLDYYLGGDGSGTALSGARHWVGPGFRVIPLAGGGAGYLEALDSMSRQVACALGNDGGLGKAGSPASCFFGGATLLVERRTAAGSEAALAFPGGPPPPQFAPQPPPVLADLRFDPARLDLDVDGLTATEEAAFGTSDLARDSDGGTTNDFEERLAGTDPNDPTDDPSALDGSRREVARFAQSTDIGRHVPTLKTQHFGAPAETPGSRGPFCTTLHCHAPDGSVLVDTGGFRAVRSVDGSFVLVFDDVGLVRVDIATGVRAPLLTYGAIGAALDARVELVSGSLTTDFRVVPIDRERTWVVGPSRVVAFDAGEAPRVLFDIEAERCAAGMGPCDARPAPISEMFVTYVNGYPSYVPMPVSDLSATLVPIGWNEALERFDVFVQGAIDAWWIGVDEQGPTIVAHGRELAGANRPDVTLTSSTRAAPPAFWVPMGDGRYFTDTVVRDTFLGSRQTLVSAEPYDALGAHLPFGGWDGRVLRAITVPGDYAALTELVAYDEGLAPGDLLLLGTSDRAVANVLVSDVMLYRMGRRGGLLPVWDAPRHDWVRPTRMALSHHSGWLCVVDDGAERVHVLGAVPTRGGIPGTSLATLESADVVDCAFDEDDALVTLHTSPPRLERRASLNGALGAATTTALTAPPEAGAQALPAFLTETRAATLEVTWAMPGAAAVPPTELDDGRIATVASGTLLLDGEPALQYGALPTGARGAIVLDRGQGDLVIASPGDSAVGYYFGTGEVYALGIRAVAATRVPGFDPVGALDPFTGGPVVRGPLASATGEPPPTIPPAPPAPSTAGATAVPDEGGCAIGSVDLAAVCVGLAIARRRRAQMRTRAITAR